MIEIGAPRRTLEICESTNDEAARWAREGAPEGAIVIAREQTRGRGRLGRVWHSPPGGSLYFSVVLRPVIDPVQVPPLTLAIGVALAEALREDGVTPELKWPNDVLVGGKKCAGILCEMSGAAGKVSHVIVGIGVNVDTEMFPPELLDIATSLVRACGRVIDRAALLERICSALARWYARFLAGGASAITGPWLAYAKLGERELTVRNGTSIVRGRAEGLDPDGTLRLRTNAGTIVRVVAGEIEAS